jgi:nucleotide-binding universal stress UspA family protein
MDPRTNILLAVDIARGDPLRHVSGAVAMVRELTRDDADQVIVLHVHEFSIMRLGAMMTGGGGAAAQHAVDAIVSGLRGSGVRACGQVREADIGHVAQTILGAARDFDARMIVLGSRGPAGLPRGPVGSVAARLLHQAVIPVLIVPGPWLAAAGRTSTAGHR